MSHFRFTPGLSVPVPKIASAIGRIANSTGDPPERMFAVMGARVTSPKYLLILFTHDGETRPRRV
jgi:hypothetical protein